MQVPYVSLADFQYFDVCIDVYSNPEVTLNLIFRPLLSFISSSVIL